MEARLAPMPTPRDFSQDASTAKPFVRVGRGLDGNPTHFDVYYGDGIDAVARSRDHRRFPVGTAGALAPSFRQRSRVIPPMWRSLHASEPLMLATDGGVHLTTDRGKS